MRIIISKFEGPSSKIVASGLIWLANLEQWALRPYYDTQILPEATIFKLGPSISDMIILMLPLKTYFSDKINFRDSDFLALFSGRPDFKGPPYEFL